MAPDDEEDSGSQVIALEDSEAFGGVAGALAGADVEPVLGEPGADELDEALEHAEASPVTQPVADARYGPGSRRRRIRSGTCSACWAS